LCRRRIRRHHGKQEQARHLDTLSLHIFLRRAGLYALQSRSVLLADAAAGFSPLSRLSRQRLTRYIKAANISLD
jgi:hypothetical protein